MSRIPMTPHSGYAHGGAVVAVWQFVTRQGWTGVMREDLVQEMLCEALTRPGQSSDYRLLYLHARDHLDPTRKGQGRQDRRSDREQSWATVPGSYRMDFVSHVYTQEVLGALPKAARGTWLAHIAYDGWSLADAARAEGVTAGTMTRRLRVVRQALLAQGMI